jgi:hypothetical protein
MRALSIVATFTLALVLGATAWWVHSYDLREFRGAAPMRDAGVFSYARYRATLGEIPLASPGSYTLRFSGLPNAKMVLQLYVVGASDVNRQLLESLTTQLYAQITDSRGNVVCSASGSPSSTDPSIHWVLMSSVSEAAFWHEGCRNVDFSRNTEYTLRVEIRTIDPRSPRVSLTATLEGGGVELS